MRRRSREIWSGLRSEFRKFFIFPYFTPSNICNDLRKAAFSKSALCGKSEAGAKFDSEFPKSQRNLNEQATRDFSIPISRKSTLSST